MKRLLSKIAVSACLLAAALAPSKAAETVHLYLKANNTPIPGDSVATGRENSIECVSFQLETYPEQDAQTGLPTGRRTYEPIRFVKRLDKASPLLMKALCNNEVIEGEFRFYRPSPVGDGTTQHYYSIEFIGGRVLGARQWKPNLYDADAGNRPEMEEISINFHKVTWTYKPGNLAHEDTVD